MTDDGERTYIAIDLKSFYASVECVARKTDGETNVERFFLEASGNGDFRGLISGFLSGGSIKKNNG